MKRTWRLIAIALLLMLFISSCTKMDGPEAAAKVSFSEWAVNIRTPYRNESYQTLENDGASATVRITVELKLKGKWTEKQIEVQCQKGDDEWQCERSILFQ